MTDNKQTIQLQPDDFAFDILTSGYIFDPCPDDPPTQNNSRYTLCNYKDDFYKWDTGRWRQVGGSEIDRLITQYSQNYNEDIATYTDKKPKIIISTNLIRNVRACLAGRVWRPETLGLNVLDNIEQYPAAKDALTILSMKSGLLILRPDGTTELIPHTPDYFSLVQLPYDYDPEAKCPLWLSFLHDSMLGRMEYVLLLQQWCGYLFLLHLRFQKFLLCVGEGANGKGVFFAIIQWLLGIENCSQVPISRFGNPFALIQTLSKMANLTHETSGLVDGQAETQLKSFTSGDRLLFERKFREGFSAIPTAKVMIATNELPRFNDKSQAIWRRILLVPFDLTVSEAEQIPDLADKLKPELSGILNWSLEGLQNLNAAGRFTVPEHSRTQLEEYRQTANPARAFLLENYTASNNGEFIAGETIYKEYSEWCGGRNYKPLGDSMFGKEVKRAFPNIQRDRQSSGKRSWIYTGIVPDVPDVPEKCCRLLST